MMRVKLSKQFKGSIFVTFKTQELADKFMNEASTKFNDTELEKMTKTAFYDKGKGKLLKILSEVKFQTQYFYFASSLFLK